MGISISYAPGVAAVAIGRGVRVGVDIEAGSAASDLLSIAEVALSDADVRRLRAMPSGRRQAAFLAAWTALEAILKARGTGFLGILPQFQLIDARSARPARSRHRCGGKCSVEVVRIVGPAGSTASLAILPGTLRNGVAALA
jgi:phosphopantetheinyl transferase